MKYCVLTHLFQLFQISRKAVRNRFEATRCWQYDYDGLHPPSDASSENKTTTSNYDLNCDITSNCSTPYGSAPVSLTEEEDKEFWSLMRYSNNEIRNTVGFQSLEIGKKVLPSFDNIFHVYLMNGLRNFFDIFAIHSSSGHEKRCQMSLRLFSLFRGSIYQQ